MSFNGKVVNHLAGLIDLPEAQQIAIRAAYEAGAELRRWFGSQLDEETKSSPADLVTRVDRESERIIMESIRERFPTHGLLGEESGWSAGVAGQAVWVIDPLDGTNNFVHGLPFFAVSIALFIDGAAQVAAVYDPMANELFSAIRAGGAYLNGRQIRVDARQQLASGLLSTRTPLGRDGAVENAANLARVAARCRSVRSMGAAALEMAYVAAGRLTGFWELRLSPWDFAAAMLVVHEAGGRVTRVDGSGLNLEAGAVVASNGPIHAELLSLLQPDA